MLDGVGPPPRLRSLAELAGAEDMTRSNTLEISLAPTYGGEKAPPLPLPLLGGWAGKGGAGEGGLGGTANAGGALAAPDAHQTSTPSHAAAPRTSLTTAAPSATSSSATPASNPSLSPAARLRSFFRPSPSSNPSAPPLQRSPSYDGTRHTEARPRPRVGNGRPATATGAGARPQSLFFHSPNAAAAGAGRDGGGTTNAATNVTERAWKGARPFGVKARPATATGANGGAGQRVDFLAALSAEKGGEGALDGAQNGGGSEGSTPRAASTQTAHAAPASLSALSAAAPATPPLAADSCRPSTATTKSLSSQGASASGHRRGPSSRQAFDSAARESGVASSLRQFAQSAQSFASRASPTVLTSTSTVGNGPARHARGTSLGSAIAQLPSREAPAPSKERKKPSLTAIKSFFTQASLDHDDRGPLAAPALTKRMSPHGSLDGVEPVTDEELAEWRAAGRARRAASASNGSRTEVSAVHGNAKRAGARRGSAEAEGELLVIGRDFAKASTKPFIPAPTPPSTAPPSRRPSEVFVLPFGTSPRSSALPFPTSSRRPSEAPSVAASTSRRASDTPSFAFPDSRRPSDTSADTVASRRPSDSPALSFFSSRRTSLTSKSTSARPKTAPAGRASPRVDQGALNVLEFVAVDAGGHGEEALPLHFPQTNGGGLDGLAPSAISPAVVQGSPPARWRLPRRSSTASSHLSLGSEEDMIISTLAATSSSPVPGQAGFPGGTASPDGSPLLGARPFLAPTPPPESSLPSSMQRLFARPGTAGGPLSQPSRRAAIPPPLQIPPSASTTRRRSSATSLGAGKGLGFAVPSTPPPRPPRAPGHTFSRSPTAPTTPVSPTAPSSPPAAAQPASAWSPLATSASLRAGTALHGCPHTAPAPAPHRPRRSTERARSSAAAALEGRRLSSESERMPVVPGGGEKRSGEWTPPLTPPRSGGLRATVQERAGEGVAVNELDLRRTG